MADLKEYTVTIDGVDHTMLLSNEDAAKRGLIEAETDVEIAALVDAEAEKIRLAFEATHAERVAELDREHADRKAELEAEFETRVATAVEEALAAGANTDKAPRARAAKTEAARAAK